MDIAEEDQLNQVSVNYRMEKTKRQGMIVTLNQLYKLIEELENEFDDDSNIWSTDDNKRFQINIINKTPKCSDTWEIDNQRTKDEKVASRIAHLETQSVQEEDNEQVECKTKDVDNLVDIDALRNPVLDTVTPIDGRRLTHRKCDDKYFKKLNDEKD